jgi:SAM-dependent methyltransferase
MAADYISVTEVPGNKASHEQIERLYQRYHFGATFCQDKDVLEAACGAGIGLGYLARRARRVIGGDIDADVLRFAEVRYRGRPTIDVRTLDAQALPFADRSFDVILLYEAIYYLPQPEKFFKEAARVLRPAGQIIICTVNKDWSDFNPSPFSVRYFSASEIYQQLRFYASEIQAYGAFPVRAETTRDRIVSGIKRTAVRFHLMPKTMKGKEIFKRIFFGRLVLIPAEMEPGTAAYTAPEPISTDSPHPNYKIIYVVART